MKYCESYHEQFKKKKRVFFSEKKCVFFPSCWRQRVQVSEPWIFPLGEPNGRPEIPQTSPQTAGGAWGTINMFKVVVFHKKKTHSFTHFLYKTIISTYLKEKKL